ncbi:MAG: 3-deoxy-manno-octulosonate cytidylyltransferase [Planctomycetes bacterium]|nr:3-deoxy-manno-octulosonate cytidylyltransferase [Planctomycetota bacterium]
MPHTPEPTTRVSRLRAVAIVPARVASTRLAKKMLLDETGLPLCVHTARNVARATAIDRVVLATDGEEVLAAAARFAVEAVATRVDHKSGTDRIFEALSKLGGDFDVVVNVQGDEPELEPGDLDRLVGAFADPAVEIATLAGPLADERELAAASVVKVVRDARGDALYFSRAPIPSAAHPRAGAPAWRELARRHVGVYAFRPRALARFCALGESRLEALENLEQLRWLEAGGRIRVLDASRVPLGIDTREDYDAFVERTRGIRSGAERPGAAAQGTAGSRGPTGPSERTPENR